jgi:hypothetical protein
VVLDHDLDVVEGHDENVCRPRLLIIRGDDDEPCFPGLERRAVVTLDQCEGLHLFEVEQRNERGLETRRRLAEACVIPRLHVLPRVSEFAKTLRASFRPANPRSRASLVVTDENNARASL